MKSVSIVMSEPDGQSPFMLLAVVAVNSGGITKLQNLGVTIDEFTEAGVLNAFRQLKEEAAKMEVE